MNITLIGMSGAGKTFIGKRLAERLGMEFVDGDALLSKAFNGLDIQAILDRYGEEEYLMYEGDINMDYTDGRDNMVLSPGGSVVYNEVWLDFLKNISKVVYLKAPFEVIEERNRSAPPHAIIGLGKKSLRQLYDERHPIYFAAADLVIEPGDSSEEVVREIARNANSWRLHETFPNSRSWRTSAQS